MNLPNKITLIRVAVIPAFMFFAVPLPVWMHLSNEFLVNYGNYIAAVIFVIAASTDAVDGYIARKRQLVTNLGKFIDPIADKLLVTAALLALVQRSEVSAWVAIIIIGRELIVTGLRLVAAGEGIVISASKLGKLKTATQIIAITATLIKNFPLNQITDFRFDDYLMILAVIVTIISGIDYITKNINVIRQDEGVRH